jgi:N utilization substance protein B
MGKRRAARELALKLLFQVDVGRTPLAEVLSHYRTDYPDASPATMEYAERLAKGTARHLSEIDRILTDMAEDWSLDRLASVDRNILRMSTYEMLYEPDMPASIAINEAVELAKKYSTEESGKFVNGILGNLARQRGIATEGGTVRAGGKGRGNAA